MTTIEISENEQKDIFKIVASVLHLGNVQFTESENGMANVKGMVEIQNISKVSICAKKNTKKTYPITSKKNFHFAYSYLAVIQNPFERP